MPVFIIGPGRSGTNLLLEILSGSSYLAPSKSPENKSLFKQPQQYSKGYLTKCDTIYFDLSKFNIQPKLFDLNFNSKILFTIRHPYDLVLSKIYRGQPYHSGGDNPVLADDATQKGVIENLNHSYKVYEYLCNHPFTDVQLVKLEDIVLNFDQSINSVCNFLDIPFEYNFYNFTNRMRNQFKKKRYNKLDVSQIGLYKHRYEIYNGFFKNSDYDLNYIFSKVNYLLDYFGYSKEI